MGIVGITRIASIATRAIGLNTRLGILQERTYVVDSFPLALGIFDPRLCFC